MTWALYNVKNYYKDKKSYVLKACLVRNSPFLVSSVVRRKETKTYKTSKRVKAKRK